MKTLLALLGGITVGAQPVALMAEQTGVFDLGSRAASLEGVDEDRIFDLFDKGESQEEGKNKLSAMSNKNYGIGKAKTFNIDGGQANNKVATSIVATYKYNDGTDSAKDIIYNISSNGSGVNAVIKNENNIGEKVLAGDLYSGDANYNSYTTSFLSTYQSSIGLTSKNNYMAYMSGIDGSENAHAEVKINFMDFSTGETVNGASIKVPNDFYKVSKIYSSTRILGNKNDNQLYMLYQNDSSGSSLSVAQYDLSDKVGNDGKFNNLTSWEK
ncbi:hypothetical protein [Spiroplasma endosymbiont of Diplazon laetatorius]|uniref:hypothetical protein n=1 Tax=Spiroplasma endosymbiont of Diplazon laetatorius TaxID=3066322 RepID=UPI0030D28B1F